MKLSDSLEGVVTRFQDELQGIRTGRANPALVTELMVDSYGTNVPLKQIAQVATPDAQSLVVSPWDASLQPAILQAIRLSDLGIEPIADGNSVRLPIPPMTEDRRRELTKAVGEKLEAARVHARNLRHQAISEVEKEELPQDALKHRKDELTKTVQKYTEQLETIAEAKKTELLQI